MVDIETQNLLHVLSKQYLHACVYNVQVIVKSKSIIKK